MPGIEDAAGLAAAANPYVMAAQAAGGLFQIGASIVGDAKAKKMEREAGPRPPYQINQEIKDNQAIAENQASQGLSDGTLQVARQNSERGITATLDAISRNGGNLNHIGEVYGAYGNQANQIAFMDEQMRAAHIASLVQQNERMSDEKDKEWQMNVYNPWADKMQRAAELRKNAAQNLSNGFGSIGGAASNFVTSQMYKPETKQVFPLTPQSPRPVGTLAEDLALRPKTSLPSIAPNSVASKWPGLTFGYNAYSSSFNGDIGEGTPVNY